MINLLLDYGINLKKYGNEYLGNCVNCDKKMSVYQNENETWIAHCSECGFHEEIAVVEQKLSVTDKPATKGVITEATPTEKAARWMYSIPDEGDVPDMESPKYGVPSKFWAYRANEGAVIGYVAQYGEELIPWTFGSYSKNLKPKWEKRSFGSPRPIYNADKIEHSAGQVIITCSEASVDAAEQLLKVPSCTTWQGRNLDVRLADWSALKGRKAVLIPDADPSGVEAMAWLAKHLLGDIKAASVSVIDTSDQPLGWDLADALDEGWDAAQTIAWAKEHKNVATLEPVDKKAAKQSTIDRADMEKKTLPDLSIVPPLQTTSVETEPIEVRQGNVISLQAQRVELSPLMPPEFSEVYLARSWSSASGKNWRYVAAWDTWMQWDGSRWVIDRRNTITHITADSMVAASNWTSAQNLTIGQKRSLCSKKNIANVLSVAGSDPIHATLPEDWDNDPFLLGTPSGIIDLRTGELRQASLSDCITKITAVTPKRGAHPVWDQLVLDRCTKGDAEMRKYYQRWAGYMLTGDCREEAFLFLHGPGGSGKSKFVDCMGDLMGDYCITAKVEMLMESKIERHTEEIACLVGARLVRTSEPEEGSRWNEALLKLLTGRDTVSARRLYEKQFTFRPQFKLIMSGNFRPALKSTGEEIRRRMHFVEFPDSIPEKDRINDLSEKLKAEWPAILQWMIDGCIEWQQHGLMRPDAVVEATKDYLSDEDTLGQWIDDCCVIDEKEKVLSSEAYHSYKKRAESHGEKPVSQKRFSQRLESRGYSRIRISTGRYIVGFKLINDISSNSSSWSDRNY